MSKCGILNMYDYALQWPHVSKSLIFFFFTLFLFFCFSFPFSEFEIYTKKFLSDFVLAPST